MTLQTLRSEVMINMSYSNVGNDTLDLQKVELLE